MHSLEDYVINHSSCVMPRCIYVENNIEINCDECQKRMIAEHDAIIRENERKKAEKDFQNSNYWNDYLAKILADERKKCIREFVYRLCSEICFGYKIDEEISKIADIFLKEQQYER